MKGMRGTTLLLSCLAFVAASLPVDVESTSDVQLRVLTPDDFSPAISSGVWFIEFFSPYCHHCRDFAPTWTQLVETSENNPGIHLAQVNCVINGDLCTENKVGGYPELNLYKDGKYVEKYKGPRHIEFLTEYINKHAELDAPIPSRDEPPPQPRVNTEGKVLTLHSQTFADAIANGPIFIKFFAPWCGHCKKLAPIWEKLASSMKDKLVIAEVNCEEHGSVCSSQGVSGYPVLNFYPANGGSKTEYSGGRKLEQLQEFSEKAISPAVQEVRAMELEDRVREHPVLYLFLHSPTDTRVVHQLTYAAQILLGSPPVFTSTSPDLFTQFGFSPSSPPILLALKDHDSIPTAVYKPTAHPAAGADIDARALKDWFIANRLPTALELSGDTFQDVMVGPHAPLVVLVGVSGSTLDADVERIREIGRMWRRSDLREKVGREVVFTWMDATRWGSWMKSMYGMTQGALPGVVIVEHKRLIYYNTDKQGQKIQLVASSVFSAIEGVIDGTSPIRHSENLIERVARFLNRTLGGIESYVRHNLLRTVLFVGVGLAIAFFALKRFIASDYISDYGDYPRSVHGNGHQRKNTRLD